MLLPESVFAVYCDTLHFINALDSYLGRLESPNRLVILKIKKSLPLLLLAYFFRFSCNR